jgi:polysaccharide chain length determinant protein (PEP-CTERM system associated)
MLGHRQLKAEDYLNILKRRAWIIAIPAILLPVIAVAVTYFIAPQFISQTLVIIEQQKVPDDYVKPVISADLDDRLASMKEQILSRSRIEPIIERLNLYPNASMESRVEAARKNISIKPIHSEISRSGGLPGFFITFKAGDPHTAQIVCGEITSLFVNENLHDREQSAQGTTDFLKGQLEDAKRNLDEQDARLAEFQRKYVGKLPGEESPNVNMLTSLNTQLEAATQQLARMQQDKTYAESMLAQQAHDLPASDPQAISASADQLELQQLTAQEADLAGRYTSDYPDLIAVRRKIVEARAKVVRSASAPRVATPAGPARAESVGTQQLRAQIRAAEQGIDAKRREQAQIQSAVRLYQDRIQSTPVVAQEYKLITRDSQTAQQFYDDLLTKMNRSKMATDLERRQQGEQFRVMDAPNLPDSPAFPKRGYFAGAGLAAGLALGLAIVILIEYRDQAIRSEDDIWDILQMPTFATISLTDPNGDEISPKPKKDPTKPRIGGPTLTGARG